MASRSGSKKQKLLSLLSQGLSASEIEDLLPTVLLSLDRAGRERLVGQLDEDTGRTLVRILDSSTGRGKSTRAKPGRKKLLQEWCQAWADWSSIVEETSDPEGDYVHQDHHWEAPFLDMPAALGDLDAVAVRLRELLPAIVEQELDPDIDFVEAVRDAGESIGAGLPGWYSSLEGDLEFGPEVTRCLLDWEWRSTEEGTGRPPWGRAFALADRLCEVESSTPAFCLDPGALAAFFLALDARQAKDLLAGIDANRRAGHWMASAESVHSTWFPIYQQLCERWRPDLYLESCRQNVKSDWRLAAPVVAALVQRKEMADALSVIEQAMSHMLRHTTEQRWDPTATLLTGRRLLGHHRADDTARIRLLRLWSKVARASGQTETAWALDLQGTLIRHWQDWDRSLATFAKNPSQRTQETHDRLFVEWRRLVAEQSTGAREGHGWIERLVDAAHGDGQPPFARALRDWLIEAGQSRQTFEQARQALEALTVDLDRGSSLRKTAPALHAMVSSRGGRPGALARSRRKWLQQLDTGSCLPDVLAVWKRRAVDLVPEPGAASGSYYGNCAAALEVVFQLDRPAYQGILRRWRVVHRRRRNLWQALTEQGLPLELEEA